MVLKTGETVATQIPLPEPTSKPITPVKKKQVELPEMKASNADFYRVGGEDLGRMDLGDPTGDDSVLEGLSELHSADYVPDKVNPADYAPEADPGQVVGGTSPPRRKQQK